MRLTRSVAPAALSLLMASSLVAAVPTTASAAPSDTRKIVYREFGSRADFAQGTLRGLRPVRTHQLRLAGKPQGTVSYAGRRYDVGRWLSPWQQQKFGLTELIASWDAVTPNHTFVEIQVRGRRAGRVGSWDTLAAWASGDATFRRTTSGSQSDDHGSVAVDTWKSNARAGVGGWQLRVNLYRPEGRKRVSPRLKTVGAMVSRLPATSSVATSTPGVARGVRLAVPRFSQMTHRGEYPQWGGGGQNWCSPTSTSMVLAYLQSLPAPSEYAWVNHSYSDRWVDHAARMTYDYGYRGTGNWPFNTAYAAQQTGHGFVTRLRDLREAERFIKAGIPVVASISFGRGELAGAPIGSTNGHLVVITGFTANGDVVVNDPAAARNRGVRRTYDRGQFENAWLPTSGGLSYIIRTPAQPLPRRAGNRNW